MYKNGGGEDTISMKKIVFCLLGVILAFGGFLGLKLSERRVAWGNGCGIDNAAFNGDNYAMSQDASLMSSGGETLARNSETNFARDSATNFAQNGAHNAPSDEVIASYCGEGYSVDTAECAAKAGVTGAEKVVNNKTQTPIMAIVIDDFGGYERSGVEEMLKITVPLTCAVIPFADNTADDLAAATAAGHEIILHMPMGSHVNLPLEWYGKVFIGVDDNAETAIKKLDECLENIGVAHGVNIHIGSGVCQNEALMTSIISHLKDRGLFFCDSRTHLKTKCEEAAKNCNAVYLGRDVFLEPHGLGGYGNACQYLKQAAQIALQKGYAVAIGHVGREGGKPTAQAIADTISEIEAMGVKIVPLSKVYERVSGMQSL